MEGEGSDEILALEAIYEDQLSVEDVGGGRRVGITIYPATADDPNSQYVCLELRFLLTEKYPQEPPEIHFSSSRGLSDISLDELRRKMLGVLEERKDECVLFDLLEMAKDTLTFNNIPSCLCSICLSGFQDGDEFLKTECFHYFHCYCLDNYKNHLDSNREGTDESVKIENTAEDPSETVVPCPVCRLPVVLVLKSIEDAIPPLDNNNYEIDEEALQAHSLKFKEIYEKQLKNGGLIDLEHEQNKYLLSNIQLAYENRKASETRAEGNSDRPNGPIPKSSGTRNGGASGTMADNKDRMLGGRFHAHGRKSHWRRHGWESRQSQGKRQDHASHHSQSDRHDEQCGKKSSRWRKNNPAKQRGRDNTEFPSCDRAQGKELGESNQADSSKEKMAAEQKSSQAQNSFTQKPRSSRSDKQDFCPQMHRRTKINTDSKNYQPRNTGTSAGKHTDEHSVDHEVVSKTGEGVSHNKTHDLPYRYPKYRPRNNCDKKDKKANSYPLSGTISSSQSVVVKTN